jgi:hypothetical protein
MGRRAWFKICLGPLRWLGCGAIVVHIRVGVCGRCGGTDERAGTRQRLLLIGSVWGIERGLWELVGGLVGGPGLRVDVKCALQIFRLVMTACP